MRTKMEVMERTLKKMEVKRKEEEEEEGEKGRGIYSPAGRSRRRSESGSHARPVPKRKGGWTGRHCPPRQRSF